MAEHQDNSPIVEIDLEQACEGCPAAYDGFAVTEATKECPFYETYVTHADGGAVEVTHHNCANIGMLGEFAGAGLIVTREVDPFTGQDIGADK
jgi:hypothetical protein